MAVGGLLFALAGGVALGAAPPPRPDPAAPVIGCRGRLDAAASEARFIVDVRLPIKAEGRFAAVDGELRPAPEGQCEVRVRLRTDTVEYSGPEWMAKLTRSAAFLDAGTHPEVAFESLAFPAAWLNEGGSIRGRLTLRGRERPVEFALRPAECDTPGQACAIRVSGEVSRRDFGMQAYRFTVKDNVRFDFAIRLEAAP